MDVDALHKEIDLIQACINRMAHNSFLLKGWAVSLVAVILALSDKDVNPIYLCAILLIPVVSFWYLDAFFLRTERMYRKMYQWVLDQRMQGNAEYQYDLNPHRFSALVDPTYKIMGSVTLRSFYGIPTVITTTIIAFKLVAFLCAKH